MFEENGFEYLEKIPEFPKNIILILIYNNIFMKTLFGKLKVIKKWQMLRRGFSLVTGSSGWSFAVGFGIMNQTTDMKEILWNKVMFPSILKKRIKLFLPEPKQI